MISLQYYEDKAFEIANLSIPDRKIIPENEPVFSVDLNSREITVPSAYRNFAVYGEHNAETIWFAFDRYFDGVDLMGKRVGLQYSNALGEVGLLPGTLIYEQNTEGKNPTILIGWKIGSELTSVIGALKISIRFFEINDTDLVYNLPTKTATVYVEEGQYITDESDNLNPSKDSLSQLVSRIEELYKNNELTGLDYTTASNKPVLNDVTLLGKLYTNKTKAQAATGVVNDSVAKHWIPVDYADLVNPPMINGNKLTPETTSQDLGISIDVDTALNITSTRPVENKVITNKFNSIEETLSGFETSIQDLWDELDGMTFIPLSINEFYHTYGFAEKGSTVNSLDFKWSLNGAATALSLEGQSLTPTLMEKTLNNLKLKEDKEFTLSATDRKGNIASAKANLIFTYKVFNGVAPEPSEYDSNFVNSLDGTLQTTRESNIMVNATTGKFIFYCVPTSYGKCTFTSGGFSGGFTKVKTISYSNVYGITEEYDIWKSDISGLGDTNVIVS